MSHNSYCSIQCGQMVVPWSSVNREDTTFVVEGVGTNLRILFERRLLEIAHRSISKDGNVL